MVSTLADLLADHTPLVLTSSGQDEFNFGRSAGRSYPLVLTSSGQDEFNFGRSAGKSTPPPNKQQQLQCIMVYILWDVFCSHFDSSRKGGNFL